MKRGSTLFLRLSLLGLDALVGFLSAVVLWSIFENWNPEYPDLMWVRYPVLAGLFISVLAFYFASFYAWQLLNYVDKSKPFSKDSINALKNIKYAAFLIGVIFSGAMPLVYWIAEKDDAPGVILFWMLFAGLPLAVGVFSGVLQHLIQSALNLKKENDLTV